MPIDLVEEIQLALAAVDLDYCTLSALDYRGDVPVPLHQMKYLERPLAYELYHTLRCRMRDWPRDSTLRLQAEVDKRYQGIIDADCAPDFLIHKPGEVTENRAVVEIKRALAGLPVAQADQRKLRRFQMPPLSYRYAIQIIVGAQRALDQVIHGLLASRVDPDTEVVLALNLEGGEVSRY